jgi:phospholipase C
MSIELSLIKTIVIVMMENRSFDHLLGYLSLPPFNRPNVEGLQNMAEIVSEYNGHNYRPFLLTDPYTLIEADPPHEREDMAIQIGENENGTYRMDGFVKNYANALGAPPITPDSKPPVMGYYGHVQVPVTHFFAENFAICDHWFCSLPAGTQPNRLMAMSGYSRIDKNNLFLPPQHLVYDWLTENNVRWRVYHEGMPFFSLMFSWVHDIAMGEHFRPFKKLYNDVEDESPETFPQVLFIEPSYTDAPHIGVSQDDHAPSAVKGGQQFLLEAYRCMSRIADVWRGIVMIVTYDEHGGFFDHVSPPTIPTNPPPDALYRTGFESLGVRVPSFVISPFVTPGHVCNDRMDHTSILKFLGQKFSVNGSYSDIVDNRPVVSVLDVLNEPSPRPRVSIPSLEPYLKKEPKAAGFTPGIAPATPIQQGFHHALRDIHHSTNKPSQSLFADLFGKFL